MPSAPTPNTPGATNPAESVENATGSERLQKLIARAGIMSRRKAEELIAEGRVSVNGHIIRELGAKADILNDHIVVDGTPLRAPSAPVILVLHKPRGYMTTRHDPEGRATVMDLLPKKYQQFHPVGRLDYDTAGVLLLTNDGELTNLLTHPSHGVTKTYWARVKGKIKRETLQKLARGIMLEDGPTAPCQARLKAETENNSLIEVVLREGRNRQVRRMFDAIGHPVRALRRVGFANLDLVGLPPGAFRELLPGEARQLRRLALEKPSKSKPEKPPRSNAKSAAKSSAKSTTPRAAKHKIAKTIEHLWED
ncbi:MAG TPA: pseudouridine synthase [Abditibacteriaceae bacterium]